MNKRFVFFTPLLMAVGLGVILYTAIGKDPTKLETARLDDPVPQFKLPALRDRQQMYTAEDLKGKVRLLNVWATWCPSCKAEHGFLVKLAKNGIPIVGLNYKDDRPGALKWLQSLGDPYEFNIFDDDLSWFNIHSDGWPPLPTINMILNNYDEISNIENLDWVSNKRVGKIYIKEIPNIDLKNKVDKYGLFPELFEITGYQNRGQTSFLKLK